MSSWAARLASQKSAPTTANTSSSSTAGPTTLPSRSQPSNPFPSIPPHKSLSTKSSTSSFSGLLPSGAGPSSGGSSGFKSIPLNGHISKKSSTSSLTDSKRLQHKRSITEDGEVDYDGAIPSMSSRGSSMHKRSLEEGELSRPSSAARADFPMAPPSPSASSSSRDKGKQKMVSISARQVANDFKRFGIEGASKEEMEELAREATERRAKEKIGGSQRGGGLDYGEIASGSGSGSGRAIITAKDVAKDFKRFDIQGATKEEMEELAREATELKSKSSRSSVGTSEKARRKSRWDEDHLERQPEKETARGRSWSRSRSRSRSRTRNRNRSRSESRSRSRSRDSRRYEHREMDGRRERVGNRSRKDEYWDRDRDLAQRHGREVDRNRDRLPRRDSRDDFGLGNRHASDDYRNPHIRSSPEIYGPAPPPGRGRDRGGRSPSWSPSVSRLERNRSRNASGLGIRARESSTSLSPVRRNGHDRRGSGAASSRDRDAHSPTLNSAASTARGVNGDRRRSTNWDIKPGDDTKSISTSQSQPSLPAMEDRGLPPHLQVNGHAKEDALGTAEAATRPAASGEISNEEKPLSAASGSIQTTAERIAAHKKRELPSAELGWRPVQLQGSLPQDRRAPVVISLGSSASKTPTLQRTALAGPSRLPSAPPTDTAPQGTKDGVRNIPLDGPIGICQTDIEGSGSGETNVALVIDSDLRRSKETKPRNPYANLLHDLPPPPLSSTLSSTKALPIPENPDIIEQDPVAEISGSHPLFVPPPLAVAQDASLGPVAQALGLLPGASTEEPPPLPLTDPEERLGPASQTETDGWMDSDPPAASYAITGRGNFYVTFDPATDGKDRKIVAEAKAKGLALPTKKKIRRDGLIKEGQELEVVDPRVAMTEENRRALLSKSHVTNVELLFAVKPYEVSALLSSHTSVAF